MHLHIFAIVHHVTFIGVAILGIRSIITLPVRVLCIRFHYDYLLVLWIVILHHRGGASNILALYYEGYKGTVMLFSVKHVCRVQAVSLTTE